MIEMFLLRSQFFCSEIRESENGETILILISNMHVPVICSLKQWPPSSYQCISEAALILLEYKNNMMISQYLSKRALVNWDEHSTKGRIKRPLKKRWKFANNEGFLHYNIGVLGG